MIEHDIVLDQIFLYSTPDGEYWCHFVVEYGKLRLVSYTKTIGEGQWIVEDLMNGRGQVVIKEEMNETLTRLESEKENS